jgi:hypothetical protein
MRCSLAWLASPGRRDHDSGRRRRTGGVDDVQRSLARTARRARSGRHLKRVRTYERNAPRAGVGIQERANGRAVLGVASAHGQKRRPELRLSQWSRGPGPLTEDRQNQNRDRSNAERWPFSGCPYTRYVYTDRMDDRPVVWDAANRRHLTEDHPDRRISLDEIGEVLADGRRVEAYLEERDAYQVIGRTATGRWLVVIWIDQPTGRYPIHVREASKRIIRRISK